MHDRLSGTLDYIENNVGLTGYVGLTQSAAVADGRHKGIGKHYAALIKEKMLTLGLSVAELEAALSFGESFRNSVERKDQRMIMRACLLAELTVRGRGLDQAPAIREDLQDCKDIAALQRRFRSHLPSIMVAQGREAWQPEKFTDPKTLPRFVDAPGLMALSTVSHDARNTGYTFLITSLPDDGLATLANLNGTIKTWDAVSTSVISSDKTIIYGNVGLIITCKPIGVFSASGSDQQFANHTGTKKNRKGAPASKELDEDLPLGKQLSDVEKLPFKLLDDGRLTEEIQRKFYEVNNNFSADSSRLMSPNEVISFTDLDHAKRGNTSGISRGWNEVTVAGPLITIVGLFLRLEKDGSLKKNSRGEPRLSTDLLRAAKACSINNHLPIVGLLDSRDA